MDSKTEPLLAEANAVAEDVRAAERRAKIAAEEDRLAKASKTRRNMLVLLWIAFGCAFMIFFEGWEVSTALYVTMQIMTTVGYGDVPVENPIAKVFSGLYTVGTVVVIGSIVLEKADEMLKENKKFLDQQIKNVRTQQREKEQNQKLAHRATHVEYKEKLHEAEEMGEFSKWSEVSTSFWIFAAFLFMGTAFYAWYEACSCSYGITRVAGCEDGERCPETGGQVKTPLDAFVMSLETLTTVGFGQFSPQTPGGRVFAIFWMLAGSLACGNFVSTFGQVVLSENKKKKMDDISRDIFDKIDENGSGELDLCEFRIYSLLKFGLVSEEDMEDIDLLFHAMDADESGSLTYEEIEQYYK
jgi:hypothetical protein